MHKSQEAGFFFFSIINFSKLDTPFSTRYYFDQIPRVLVARKVMTSELLFESEQTLFTYTITFHVIAHA